MIDKSPDKQQTIAHIVLLTLSLLALIWICLVLNVLAIGYCLGGIITSIHDGIVIAIPIAAVMASVIHFYVLSRVKRGRTLIAWTIIAIAILLPIVYSVVDRYQNPASYGPYPLF
jgi:hypothetical protein